MAPAQLPFRPARSRRPSMTMSARRFSWPSAQSRRRPSKARVASDRITSLLPWTWPKLDSCAQMETRISAGTPKRWVTSHGTRSVRWPRLGDAGGGDGVLDIGAGGAAELGLVAVQPDDVGIGRQTRQFALVLAARRTPPWRARKPCFQPSKPGLVVSPDRRRRLRRGPGRRRRRLRLRRRLRGRQHGLRRRQHGRAGRDGQDQQEAGGKAHDGQASVPGSEVAITSARHRQSVAATLL
jgi:hypothetical protein